MINGRSPCWSPEIPDIHLNSHARQLRNKPSNPVTDGGIFVNKLIFED